MCVYIYSVCVSTYACMYVHVFLTVILSVNKAFQTFSLLNKTT